MVHFVGAGSGAVDLITVRGQRLLENADVIVYAGSLVNPELLSFRKEDCAVYNSALMDLDEVLSVMYEAEAKGLDTVRLHTGDPSVYGAVREQMDALKKKGIAFDVCPGVSSFLAAAASLQAEYTLPGVSQSLIITRISGRTKVKDAESLRSFAAHKASMAIFLSIAYIGEVVGELIAGGYTQDTPSAVVYKASWSDEKIIRCPLGKLAFEVKEQQIEKTALIVVGDFLGGDYELSRLYDREFSTMYRKGKSE